MVRVCLLSTWKLGEVVKVGFVLIGSSPLFIRLTWKLWIGAVSSSACGDFSGRCGDISRKTPLFLFLNWPTVLFRDTIYS